MQHYSTSDGERLVNSTSRNNMNWRLEIYGLASTNICMRAVPCSILDANSYYFWTYRLQVHIEIYG